MKKQQGFTLIEIIAVLVILGILAAVAIPKYNDLQEQARVRGAQGIMAGAMSQLSLSYSNALLNDAIDVTNINAQAECDKVAITGAYGLVCTDAGGGNGGLTNDVTITVNHPDLNTNVSETWQSPE